MSAVVDPYASTPRSAGYLHRLNPLAKMAAPLPAIVALVFVRDLQTPALLLIAAVVVVLTGTRLTARMTAAILLGLPAMILLITAGMAVWVDPSGVNQSVTLVRIGDWRLYGGAVLVALATGLRLGAIIALALVAGLSTSGTDLVRASVQHLRVPYRVGYTALAAFRFVPRFGHELDLIRQAHRVRGGDGRGPLAALARQWGSIVPLLAGAIRHAERVALAMDARAFGAFPYRTERHTIPFTALDGAVIALCWVATAAVFAVGFPWTL